MIETYFQTEIANKANTAKRKKALEPMLTYIAKFPDSYTKTRILIAIAKTISKLKNTTEADKYLQRSLIAAEEIRDSSDKTRVLIEIAYAQTKLGLWRQAHTTVSKCPTDECKAESLIQILTAWAEKKNPALVEVDKDKDKFFEKYLRQRGAANP
jgi:hypothetical protein